MATIQCARPQARPFCSLQPRQGASSLTVPGAATCRRAGSSIGRSGGSGGRAASRRCRLAVEAKKQHKAGGGSGQQHAAEAAAKQQAAPASSGAGSSSSGGGGGSGSAAVAPAPAVPTTTFQLPRGASLQNLDLSNLQLELRGDELVFRLKEQPAEGEGGSSGEDADGGEGGLGPTVRRCLEALRGCRACMPVAHACVPWCPPPLSRSVLLSC